MSDMLDCVVNYIGLNEDEEYMPARYFSYHIIASPGPTLDGGAASITMLALYDESARCHYCQKFHVVKTGGQLAAIMAAIRYLDAYHQHDHLGRFQSEIRSLSAGESLQMAVPPLAATVQDAPSILVGNG
jgi:hypothetical protein